MKSIAKDEVKGKTKEDLGKLMNDPTLEGRDENKVGRIQRKTRPADTTASKKVTGPAAPIRDQYVAI